MEKIAFIGLGIMGSRMAVMARETDTPLPSGLITEQSFAAAMEAVGGNADMSGVFKYFNQSSEENG